MKVYVVNHHSCHCNTNGECIILCDKPACQRRCVKVAVSCVSDNEHVCCKDHGYFGPDDCDFDGKARSLKLC